MPKPKLKTRTLNHAGTPRMGAKHRQAVRNQLRMPRSRILSLVRHEDDQARTWAREGLLTSCVLAEGDLDHLRALARMGTRFEDLAWRDAHRVAGWTQAHARDWMDTLFDHGWKGRGGMVEVAQYHPGLLDLWKTRAPSVWQQRHVALQGKLVLALCPDPDSVLAWLRLGATPAPTTGDRIGIHSWIAQSKTGEGSDTLRAIHGFMREDRARRRVRGEPPFRDWPWAYTLDAAVERGRLDLVDTLASLVGPPTIEQAMQLVCRAPQAGQMLDAVRERDWKLPSVGSKLAGRFLSLAMLCQQAIPATTQERERLALRLMEEGYGGPLTPEAVIYLNSTKASETLRVGYQHQQLSQATPHSPGPAPRPRARL